MPVTDLIGQILERIKILITGPPSQMLCQLMVASRTPSGDRWTQRLPEALPQTTSTWVDSTCASAPRRRVPSGTATVA